MNFPEARKVLGLGPDEDPRPHLAEFKAARERIAEMVRDAPNETLGLRYQKGLMEFDQALAAVQEHLETLGLAPRREPVTMEPPREIAPPVADEAREGPGPAKRSRAASFFAWFLIFLLGAGGGALLYFKDEEDKKIRGMARIAYLEREGAVFAENRRWQEAKRSFDEIERLDPGSEIARRGLRSIEAGMAEEQTQFIGYWTGQAIAELESGRLDEADAAVRQVTSRFPHEAEALAIAARIAEARNSQSRDLRLREAREALDASAWDKARGLARRILAEDPADPDAQAVLDEAENGIARDEADSMRAAELLARAKSRDAGRYDAEAIEWLREAVSLAPENSEIRAMFEKMSSYTRTLRVPGDHATPAEALAGAKEKDRIVLAEGVWKGPLVVAMNVVLEGAGPDKTIIECPPDAGSALTIGPDCRGANVSGLAIRHESIQLTGDDRFSAALVRGGGATFVDCHFLDASGHGLAVIERGEAVAQRCVFRDNGWNGAAAIGEGAMLEVSDSECAGNFENGVEAWDGASLSLVRSRCIENSRNGAHVDARSAVVTLQTNQLAGNREFGIVISGAGSGNISHNIARNNLLGGIVIRRGGAGLTAAGNEATSNSGPGIVLEQGVDPGMFADSKVAGNEGGGILADVDLEPEAEAEPERESHASPEGAENR